MTSINNRRNRLIISTILGLPAYGVFALIRNFPFSQITLYAYTEYSLTAISAFFLLFEAQNINSKLLNRFITWQRDVTKRFVLEALISFLITVCIVYIFYSGLYKLVWDMDIFLPSLYLYISLVFFISMAFMAFVNIVPLIDEWKQSIIYAERLEKETANAKMEALTTQLSPHFFFNNLSILNGLITGKPVQAKKFVSKLSEVFRYILSHKNDEIVPLKKEIDFISDYNFLLERRFEKKFSVEIKIKNFDYWIPPVTIQQLIENAIKHNEISDKKPLLVNISENKGYLTVKNNKQLRSAKIRSTNIGLKNIKQRFALLTESEVVINECEEYYVVSLPLIQYDESSNN